MSVIIGTCDTCHGIVVNREPTPERWTVRGWQHVTRPLHHHQATVGGRLTDRGALTSPPHEPTVDYPQGGWRDCPALICVMTQLGGESGAIAGVLARQAGMQVELRRTYGLEAIMHAPEEGVSRHGWIEWRDATPPVTLTLDELDYLFEQAGFSKAKRDHLLYITMKESQ